MGALRISGNDPRKTGTILSRFLNRLILQDHGIYVAMVVLPLVLLTTVASLSLVALRVARERLAYIDVQRGRINQVPGVVSGESSSRRHRLDSLTTLIPSHDRSPEKAKQKPGEQEWWPFQAGWRQLGSKYLKSYVSDVAGGVDSSGSDHADSARQQHTVPLQNLNAVQYFGKILIGDPRHPMEVMFDTGSSDTWVPESRCTGCGLKPAFDNLSSSTAVPMGRNFTNRYDSGSVRGRVIEESVTIGGVSVKNVEMGLVRRQEQHIRGFRADGIVGLAFPSISSNRKSSPSRHSTFLQLLQEQFGTVGDVFSVYLTPSRNQPGSTLIFGGYDLDLVRRPKRRKNEDVNDRKDKRQRLHEPPSAESQVLRRDSEQARPRRMTQQEREFTGDDGTWKLGSVGTNNRGSGYMDTAIKDNEDSMDIVADRLLLVGGKYGGSKERKGELEEEGNSGFLGKGKKKQEREGVDDDPVIIWTPVVEYHGLISYWTLELTGLRIETKTIEEGETDSNDHPEAAARPGRLGGHRKGKIVSGHDLCPAGCQAIVDTGCSLLVPPKNNFQAVIQQITSGRTDCKMRQGMASCSRCTPSDFPDVVISVAASKRDFGLTALDNEQRREKPKAGGSGGSFSQEFRLKPSDYLLQNWNRCDILVGEGRATDIWILGDAFIKTYMTIFDVANLRIGFVCADGGRCLGGVEPPHPSSRLCIPSGRATNGIDYFSVYCVNFYLQTGTWALCVGSFILVIVCYMLWAQKNHSDSADHGITSPTAPLSPAFLSSTTSKYFLSREKKDQSPQQRHRNLL